MMEMARILFQSPRIDTYADVVAAIAKGHPAIEGVQLVFFDGPVKEEIVNSVQTKLAELSSIPEYAYAARLRIDSKKMDINSKELFENIFLVDVTCIAKDTAIEVAALAIEYSKTKVGLLRWIKRVDKENPRVGKNDYSYEDLLTKGAIGKLLKKYVGKCHVLWSFSFLFGVLVLIATAKIVWPGFVVPNDVINIFSLLIGAAGLYLAAISLKAY